MIYQYYPVNSVLTHYQQFFGERDDSSFLETRRVFNEVQTHTENPLQLLKNVNTDSKKSLEELRYIVENNNSVHDIFAKVLNKFGSNKKEREKFFEQHIDRNAEYTGKYEENIALRTYLLQGQVQSTQSSTPPVNKYKKASSHQVYIKGEVPTTKTRGAEITSGEEAELRQISVDTTSTFTREFRKRFVKDLAPLAKACETKYNIPYKGILTVFLTESGWGRGSDRKGNYGKYSKNGFFNITGTSGYLSIGSMKRGDHDRSGNRITQNFLTYDSLYDSFMGFGKYIQNCTMGPNSTELRYKKARVQTDPIKFINAMVDEGYSGSGYKDTAKNIINLNLSHI